MARASTSRIVGSSGDALIGSPTIKDDGKRASARTVVVMCKIWNGLILQLQEKRRFPVSTRDGIVHEDRWTFHGKRYWVSGPAYPVGQTPKGFPEKPTIEGGYAMTRGIPKDFWEQWAEQNKDSDFFQPKEGAERGMIFAMDDVDDAVAIAREHADQRSGLEPLDVETVDKDGRFTDPRMPKPVNMAVAKVHPADVR